MLRDWFWEIVYTINYFRTPPQPGPLTKEEKWVGVLIIGILLVSCLVTELTWHYFTGDWMLW